MIDAYILWHGSDPIGWVSFSSGSLASTLRTKVFGRDLNATAVNKWFSNANRIVIDPRYRGAGIGADMLRKACKTHAEQTGKRYITLKTSMGAVNKFGEAAGFDFVQKNRQLGRHHGTGGFGNAPSVHENQDYDTGKLRVVYEYLLDAKAEFGIDYDAQARSRGQDS